MENKNSAENAACMSEVQLMEQKFRDASIVLGIFITGIVLWVMFYALWEHLGRPFAVEYMIQGVDFVGFLMFLSALRHTSFSLKESGLWTDNPKKVIKQSLVLCVISFFVLALIKYFGQLFDPTLFQTEHGFFDIKR